MLKQFRKNTRSIIWTVIIAFILWGGFSVGTQFKKEGRFAGRVFGKDISFQEFDRFYKAVQIFTFAEQPVESADIVRQTAWQSLIYSRAAKNRGIEVTDEEVRERLVELLNRHQISPSAYPMWVERSLHVTTNEFENQIREILRIQKLMTELSARIAIDPKLLEGEALKKFQADHPGAAPQEFEAAKEELIKKALEEKKQSALFEQLRDILQKAELQDYQPVPGQDS